MRTLNLYITKGLLVIFTTAIFILTFVMIGGNILQMLHYLVRGIPIGDFLQAMLCLLPMVLSFTVPCSILVAVLLLFGKMSADNQITAMRASGISIFQIISPLIILTFFLTVICLYLQVHAGPYFVGKARSILDNLPTTAPQALLSPGQPRDFGNMVVYVKDKKKDKLTGVQIFVFDRHRQGVDKDITAANGEIEADKETGILKLILYDYNIIDNREDNRLSGEKFTVAIDVAKAQNERPLFQRIDFMTFKELLGTISLYNKIGLDTLEYEIALNLRFAMGLAPIAFLLIGLPLAINTSRKETSVGLFLSVMFAAVYFFFTIGCKMMGLGPALYPQYLLWIPNIVYQAGGLFFIIRLTRR